MSGVLNILLKWPEAGFTLFRPSWRFIWRCERMSAKPTFWWIWSKSETNNSQKGGISMRPSKLIWREELVLFARETEEELPNNRWWCKTGPPKPTISRFIPSYTHLQPWLNRVCWGYNYLITRGPLLVRVGLLLLLLAEFFWRFQTATFWVLQEWLQSLCPFAQVAVFEEDSRWDCWWWRETWIKAPGCIKNTLKMMW